MVPCPTTKRLEGGFALLLVLWTLVLVAFIVAHVIGTGRTEVRIANNLIADANAQAAADGAIFAAIFNRSDPLPEQHWPADGYIRELAVGNCRVLVRLEDEAWWINPSSASPAVLEALLRVTGSDPERSRRLANAIGEWVGSVPVARPQNQVLADYTAAGLDYAPLGAPLETLDELARVVGMPPDVLAAIRPHLTLFGPAQPSATSADPIVAAALIQAGHATAVPLAAEPPPDVLTARITASTVGPGDGRATRRAIIRFGAALPGGYEVLAWGDAS